MALDLSLLNTNQQTAVAWEKGPLLVLAGPGSGKTKVLTTRIVRLLSESPDKRFRILGLTFTTKAADEMRSRIDALISDGRDRVALATFHSFAADVLRQHGSHVGFRPDFVILNQTADREAVLLDAIRECARVGIETDESDVKLLPFLDRLLDTCTHPDEVRNRVRDPDLADKAAALFAQYRLELEKTNRLDFPCLLSKAIELLESKPAVARLLRTTYTRVCVDEFQDTNYSQYRFLRAIVGEAPPDLFVVADDDQIIYQWNGASPERLLELRNDYKMSVVQLPANYRCPPAVIDLANKLIQHNHSRSADKQPLIAIKPVDRADSVRLHRFDEAAEELAWVATDIASRGPKVHGKCVVLARTKQVLETAAEALQAAGVTPALHVRKDEFESAAFRWLHSILRLANARGDREQVRRACKAFYTIDGLDLRVEQVLASAAVTGGDLLRAWFEETLAKDALSDLSREFLTALRTHIVSRLDFPGFISTSLDWFRQLHADDGRDLEALGDFQAEEGMWRELVQTIRDRLGDGMTLEAFLQEMDLAPKVPPPPPNATRCLTIHTSKGMEFEHVYLVGLVEDQLPSFQAVKKGPQSRELQEERRNCFVAITRAQLSLTLTYARRYSGWQKLPSRFLSEMGLLGDGA
ncbi:MAG: ATP-dependent helicase [Bryobacteraceae bacterium]|nr:ATP-dependent helicase [Bryobacteraceae bacterium]